MRNLLTFFFRLLFALFLVSSVVFVFLRILPGNIAHRIAGMDADASVIEAIETKLGSNEPLFTQYIRWFSSLIRFDFGESLYTAENVSEIVILSLIPTISIAGISFVLSLLFSIFLAFWVYRSSRVKFFFAPTSLTTLALPPFVIAFFFLVIFSVWFPILPVWNPRSLLSFIIPILTLSMVNSAILSRYIITLLSEEYDKMYVTVARAFGASYHHIQWRHVLPSIFPAIIIFAGFQLGYLISGSIIVESMFSIPGMGLLIVQAVLRRDYPVVQAGALVLTFFHVLVNSIAEEVARRSNPLLP